MEIVNLYRYENADGSVTVTPNARTEGDAPSLIRLVADDGMQLSNGEIVAKCIDVESADGWAEEQYLEDGSTPDTWRGKT